MPIEGHVHHRRDRAESFGAVAADYDRYRPGYPDALIADLVALRPARVLDVGCGTGKAARLLRGAGLRVLGVEIDPAMAAVARSHGLDVEIGSFESWDDNGRTFDLITSAQAWHWVEPMAGARKAARLLTPGGTLALFWNFSDVEDDVQAAVDEVYGRLAPELTDLVAKGASSREDRPYRADLRKSGAFESITTRTYTWTRSEPLAEWVGRAGTQSDHLLLGKDRLADLLDALRAALTPLGPLIRATGGTYTILARVAS